MTYYSLRDYQTGEWVGGAAGCTHQRTPPDLPKDPTSTLHGRANNQNHEREGYKGTCPRCGAVRVDAQIGLESTADCLGWARQEPPCAGGCWVCAMRAVFKEVHRVMRPEATLWINCGDAYIGNASSGGAGPRVGGGIPYRLNAMPTKRGLPPKSLLGLPWRLALALQADGFILRSEIIWEKINCMPESTRDRPTRAHEQIFLFSKQGKYYYDGEAVREPHQPTSHDRARYLSCGTIGKGKKSDAMTYSSAFADYHLNPNGRAMRSVLSLASEPTPFAHFATFPTALVRRCLLAGAPTMVCAQCQAPWVRTVERGPVAEGYTPGYTPAFQVRRFASATPGFTRQVTTTGFSPSCTCNALTRPSVILDPFAGSGTTLLVARELGLHGIGLDLSYPYLRDIARERLGLADLHRWTHGGEARPATYSDLPLFALEHL